MGRTSGTGVTWHRCRDHPAGLGRPRVSGQHPRRGSQAPLTASGELFVHGLPRLAPSITGAAPTPQPPGLPPRPQGARSGLLAWESRAEPRPGPRAAGGSQGRPQPNVELIASPRWAQALPRPHKTQTRGLLWVGENRASPPVTWRKGVSTVRLLSPGSAGSSEAVGGQTVTRCDERSHVGRFCPPAATQECGLHAGEARGAPSPIPSAAAVRGHCRGHSGSRSCPQAGLLAAGTCTLQVVSPKQGTLNEPVFADSAAGRAFQLPGLVRGPQASGVCGV